MGGIINEKVGTKLQRVKMVEGYNRVKISPSSEKDNLDIWGWNLKREVGKEAAKG